MLKFGKVETIQDFSKIIRNVPDKKISKYYEAEGYFINYNLPIALFGTRRLGKTVTLNQLWNKYHTDKSVYLHIGVDTEFNELLNYVRKLNSVDQIYIDEITNIIALDYYIATLLDYVIAANIKLICTGTCSLLLQYTFNNQASGRFNVVNYNPPIYEDYNLITNASFDEFMKGQNTFYTSNHYIEDLSNDIFNAIERGTSSGLTSLEALSIDDIQRVLKIIIESCFSLSTSKPKNKLIFTKKYYYLSQSQLVYNIQDISMNMVQEIFNNLIRLGVMTPIPMYDLSGSNPCSYELYINTPLLYRELIEQYSQIPNELKEGILFETSSITQIEILTRDIEGIYCYAVRTPESIDGSSIEYDLVIQTPKIVYLIDFKRSASKVNKYKDNPEVINYYHNLNPDLVCVFHTVYLRGSSDNSNAFYIVDYINKIKEELNKYK